MGGQIAAGNEEVDEKEEEVGGCVESGIKEEVNDGRICIDCVMLTYILICVFNKILSKSEIILSPYSFLIPALPDG